MYPSVSTSGGSRTMSVSYSEPVLSDAMDWGFTSAGTNGTGVLAIRPYVCVCVCVCDYGCCFSGNACVCSVHCSPPSWFVTCCFVSAECVYAIPFHCAAQASPHPAV